MNELQQLPLSGLPTSRIPPPQGKPSDCHANPLTYSLACGRAATFALDHLPFLCIFWTLAEEWFNFARRLR